MVALAAKVLLVTVSVPELKMPPLTLFVVLAEKVLLVMLSVPELFMPPPLPVAKLPETVLLKMLSVPELKMPAPPVHAAQELSETVLLVMVSTPALLMPPPPLPALLPFAIVKWLRVSAALLLTNITWTALFPLIVTPCPPSIITLELIAGKVLAKVIAPTLLPKTIVVPVESPAAQCPPLTSAPALAFLIASRKVQTPSAGVSLDVVTVMVASPGAGELANKM